MNYIRKFHSNVRFKAMKWNSLENNRKIKRILKVFLCNYMSGFKECELILGLILKSHLRRI
jgi:hypothetical protein